MTVTTDNKWHDFVLRDDVPEQVIADQFAYLDDFAYDGFFKYRGSWYHVSDFMSVTHGHPLHGEWDGYLADSAFSGVVIKVDELDWRYKVGTFIV